VLDSAELRARLSGVRDRIARAATRAGRDPASVTLVAVSKTFPSSAIRSLAEEGQLDFGENKVQEALTKMAELPTLPLRWHLVGHLQSNKARRAAQHFHVIHSVDDVALLERIDEAGRLASRTVDVLIQVDLSGEPTKHGAVEESLAGLFEAADRCPAALVRGLMLLPPAADDPEASRPFFAALARLRRRLMEAGVSPARLTELSMGMSKDFEVAIEEGATIVRVGTAIFGERGGLSTR
jgi:hypothetical protein